MSFFCFPGSVSADKASDDFSLGLGFYRGKRWEQAAETLGQFLKDFPEHPRAGTARLYLARSLSVLEKYEPARTEFIRFIQESPESKDIADARYRLGECSYFLKDYPSAIIQLDEYLRKHSTHALSDWARLLLGDSYASTKEYEKAIEILTPLATGDGETTIVTDASFSLGKALEGLKRYPDAIEKYRLVIESENSPSAARALNRIASIQYSLGQYAEAAGSFEQLARTFPTSGLLNSACLGAGMSFYRSGDHESAVSWLQKVPQDSPGKAQAIMITAMSLKELGRIDESRQTMAEALRAAGETAFAADVLYQQAQLERASESKETSARIFEDIVDRWPRFSRNSECLFLAAELRLELSQIEHVERLWNRLKTDFPEAALRTREQILLGRIYLAKKNPETAAETFLNALQTGASTDRGADAVAQYYLIRAYFELERHADVIAQMPQLRDFLEKDEFREIRGALALASFSSIELRQYQEAVIFSDEFLRTAVDNRQIRDVKAARSVAKAHLQRYGEALNELTELTKSEPVDTQAWTAVLKVAEVALEQKKLADAKQFFALAATHELDPEVREAGLSGMAWSHFRAGEFNQAAEFFLKVIMAFPQSEGLPQARFMLARSIEEQNDDSRTAEAYLEVFNILTTDLTPAPAGAEKQPPLQFAFDAGRQAARFLEKGKRIDEADKVWERLVSKFPAAEELDRILDEWAWMNVTAQRFARSDEIHRRLLRDFPDSVFAGQARLSLAESLLESGKLEESLKEMNAIAGDAKYGASEKERALFHAIEIHASQQTWQFVQQSAGQFLERFSGSPLSPQVRLFSGNALLELQQPDAATEILNRLREDIVAEKIPTQDWIDRVWIVLAEAALASKRYEDIDGLEKELLERSAESAFGFQMMDIQGRRWKQQAPPDFEKARTYFVRVTSDPRGQGTETAARCQFLLAETLVLQMRLDEAVKEYFKVYLNYAYDELRAQALFQAAVCEARLKRTDFAIRDFQELVETFPQSPLVPRAQAELKRLNDSMEAKN